MGEEICFPTAENSPKADKTDARSGTRRQPIWPRFRFIAKIALFPHDLAMFRDFRNIPLVICDRIDLRIYLFSYCDVHER